MKHGKQIYGNSPQINCEQFPKNWQTFHILSIFEAESFLNGKAGKCISWNYQLHQALTNPLPKSCRSTGGWVNSNIISAGHSYQSTMYSAGTIHNQAIVPTDLGESEPSCPIEPSQSSLGDTCSDAWLGLHWVKQRHRMKNRINITWELHISFPTWWMDLHGKQMLNMGALHRHGTSPD